MTKSRGIRNRGLAQRFWPKVIVNPDGCWEWGAARSGNGYGLIREDREKGSKNEAAHRVAWVLTHGPIPDGLWVMHRCDNPPCVRPDHLMLGTPTDNNRDTVSKGRLPKTQNRFPVRRGAENHAAKMTEDTVREVRALYAAGATQDQLAERYSLTQQGVSAIVRAKVWKHVA